MNVALAAMPAAGTIGRPDEVRGDEQPPLFLSEDRAWTSIYSFMNTKAISWVVCQQEGKCAGPVFS